MCAPESISSVPGGFCTAICKLAGDGVPCPDHSRCVGVTGDPIFGVCLPMCLTSSDCVGPDPEDPLFKGSCRQLFYGDEPGPLTCRRMCDELDGCSEPRVCDERYHTCRLENEADGCIDEDEDGWPDCETAACWQKCATATEVQCEDGFDNDADEKIDCEDPDCWFHTLCTGAEIRCSDGIDDDGDGDIDCADSDCFGHSICGGETDCSDGIDNNGNGYVDCHDYDCLYAHECMSEAWCGLDEGCCTNLDVNGDPIDDDGDGFANCADPDCALLPLACPDIVWGDEGGVELDCGNFDDDDGDGWIDCLDPDCDDDVGCVPGTMPLGGPCSAHSDCVGGAPWLQPMCLMTGPDTALGGTCTQTCKLDDPVATCSQDIDGDGVDDGYRCIDTGFGGGIGLCLPGCFDDEDCAAVAAAGGSAPTTCVESGLGLSFGVCDRRPRVGSGDSCVADGDCCSGSCDAGTCTTVASGSWQTLAVFAVEIPATGIWTETEQSIAPLATENWPNGDPAPAAALPMGTKLRVAPFDRNSSGCGDDADPVADGLGATCLVMAVEMLPTGPQDDLWLELLSWQGGTAPSLAEADDQLFVPEPSVGRSPPPGLVAPVGWAGDGARVSSGAAEWISHPALFELDASEIGGTATLLVALRAWTPLPVPSGCRVETDCADSVDGDLDGQTDCADPDCRLQRQCHGALTANGGACASDEECDSGACVDGHCAKRLDLPLPTIDDWLPAGMDFESVLMRNFVYAESPGYGAAYAASLQEVMNNSSVVGDLTALYETAGFSPLSGERGSDWVREHILFLLGEVQDPSAV
ncbi:MAG: hypothetical protein H6700_12100, partial [Myxococcales bacterium]|nr:hypothetical protein [Myxococcales bacterium]